MCVGVPFPLSSKFCVGYTAFPPNNSVWGTQLFPLIILCGGTQSFPFIQGNINCYLYVGAQWYCCQCTDLLGSRPHKRDEAIHFTVLMDRFFDCLNVKSPTEGKHGRKETRMPYQTPSDWRFKVSIFISSIIRANSLSSFSKPSWAMTLVALSMKVKWTPFFTEHQWV